MCLPGAGCGASPGRGQELARRILFRWVGLRCRQFAAALGNQQLVHRQFSGLVMKLQTTPVFEKRYEHHLPLVKAESFQLRRVFGRYLASTSSIVVFVQLGQPKM